MKGLIFGAILCVGITVPVYAGNDLYPEYEARYPGDIGYARQQADKEAEIEREREEKYWQEEQEEYYQRRKAKEDAEQNEKAFSPWD